MARDIGTSLLSGLSGAMQGYDFVQGQRERKQTMGLREAANQRDQQRADTLQRATEQEMSLRDLENQRAGERHSSLMKNSEQNFQHADAQEKRAAESHNATRARELLADQDLMEGILARNLWAAEQSGYVPEFSAREREAMKLYPQLGADYDMAGAIGIAKEVINGKRDINSPEALDAINKLFPEVQAGADDGRARRVTMVAPGRDPETFVFGLEVAGEKTPKPLTVRRSADADDPVKQVRLEDMAKRVAAAEQFNNAKISPQFRQYLYHKHGLIKQGEKFGEMMIDPATGLPGQKNLRTGEFVSKGGNRTQRNIEKEATDHAHRMATGEQRSHDGTEPFDYAARVRHHAADYLQRNGFAPPATAAEPASAPSAPPAGRAQAPQKALEALKSRPELKDQFLAKYGYLPEEEPPAPNAQAPQAEAAPAQPAPPADPKLEAAASKYLEIQNRIHAYTAPRGRGAKPIGDQEKIELKAMRAAVEKLERYINAKGGKVPSFAPTANLQQPSRAPGSRAESIALANQQKLERELAEIEELYLSDPTLSSK